MGRALLRRGDCADIDIPRWLHGHSLCGQGRPGCVAHTDSSAGREEPIIQTLAAEETLGCVITIPVPGQYVVQVKPGADDVLEARAAGRKSFFDSTKYLFRLLVPGSGVVRGMHAPHDAVASCTVAERGSSCGCVGGGVVYRDSGYGVDLYNGGRTAGTQAGNRPPDGVLLLACALRATAEDPLTTTALSILETAAMAIS